MDTSRSVSGFDAGRAASRSRMRALLAALIMLGATAADAARRDDRSLPPRLGSGILSQTARPTTGDRAELLIAGAGEARGRPCKGKRCPTPTATAAPTSTPVATATPAPTSTPPPTTVPTPPAEAAIEILAPGDGTLLREDRIRVEGTYAPSSSAAAVTVNGLAGVARDGRFVVNEVPLEAGESPIEAILHMAGVPAATAVVRVTSEALPPALELRATPESGVAPLAVRFEWRVGTAAPIESVTLDAEDDGTIDHSSTTEGGGFDHVYAASGLFQARAAVRHVDGSTHETVVTIEVLDVDLVDAAVRGSWSAMNAALASGDVAAATAHMTPSAGTKYRPVFERLAPKLAEIVASYGEMKLRSVGETVATYVVTRRVGDSTGVFFVTFEKGADGVWRMSSM